MDKFDESIKQARADYQPSADFTDRVMDRVEADSAKKGRSFALGWQKLGVSVAGLAAVLAIVFAGNSTVFHTSQSNPSPSTNGKQTTVGTTASTATDEYSSEINAINQEFAADNVNNSVTSDQLNDLTP